MAILFNFSEPAGDVAFPFITRDFGISVAQVKWLPVALLMTFIPTALLFGQLGDLFGHRRVFVAGAGFCSLTLALCAFSTTYEWLIASRLAQGVAAGASVSCIVALMTLMHPPAHKRRVIGVFVLTLGCTYAVAPVAGSIITEHFGWRAIFASRALLALLVFVFGALLPVSAPISTGRKADWRGSVWLLLAVCCLMTAAATLPDSEHRAGVVLLLLAAVAGMYFFARWEKRCQNPIIEVRYFANPLFLFTQVAVLVFNICAFSLMLLIPFVSYRLFNTISLENGLMLALMPAGMMAGAAAVGRLAVSSLTIAMAGMLLTAAGLLACGMFTDEAALLAGALFAAGIGVGFFQTSYSDITTSLLPLSARGVAGSLSSLMPRFGFGLGAGSIMTLPEVFRARGAAMDEYGVTLLIFGLLLLLFSAVFVIVFKFLRTMEQ